MFEKWREKWNNRQKLTCRHNLASARKWVQTFQKDLEKPLYIDWHPKDEFVVYTKGEEPIVMPELFRDAANSMMYMILQGAKDNDNSFGEELANWIDSWAETTEPDALAILAEDLECELREGWSFTGYGHPRFLEKLARHIGEGYSDVMFYQMAARIWKKINEEEHGDDTVSSSSDE